MKIKSFAKINLGLEIVARRPDGYHEIRTLFQSVDFFDELSFRVRPDGRIRLSGDDPGIPWGEENLIFRAAQALRRSVRADLGAEIEVKKRIPAGKGLGGGSSNAAMALFALNRLWRLNLHVTDLIALGKELGSDIPYFFFGGLCLGTGRGDRVQPLEDLPALPCLILLPPFPVWTPSVYRELRLPLTSFPEESKIIEFLNTRDYKSLENQLEEIVLRLHPQLKAYRNDIRALNPDLSLVTGSGSAVFGLFPETLSPLEEKKVLDDRDSVVVTETISRRRYWQEINAGV